MSEALTYARAVRDSEAIRALPWEKQVEARRQIWDKYVSLDASSYQEYGEEGLSKLEKAFLTKVPDEIKEQALRMGDRTKIDPVLANAEPEMFMNVARLEDIDKIRKGIPMDHTSNPRFEQDAQTEMNTRNFGMGFQRAFGNISLGGKAGMKIGNELFGQGAMFGEKATKVENFRDYVNEVYGHKDVGHIVGKTVGTAVALALNFKGFHKAFGSVGAGGLFTKGMQEAIFKGTVNSNAIVRAVVPTLAQAAVEVTGGTLYNMAHDLIDGKRLDETRIAETPGQQMLNELIFFGAGEALGFLGPKVLGGVANIFNPARAIKTHNAVLLNQTTDDIVNQISDIVSGKSKSFNPDTISALNSLNPKAAQKLNEVMTAGQLAKAKLDAGQSKEAIEELMFKTIYDMDVTIKPDGKVQVLKSAGKDINKTFPVENLYKWMQKNVETAKNVDFAELGKQYGRRFTETTIGVRGKQGLKVSKLGWENTVKTFAPVNGKVNIDNVKAFVDTNLGKAGADLKIEFVDDFFKADIQPKAGVLYIPKEVKGSVEAKNFADTMFKQFEAVLPGVKIRAANFKKYLQRIGNIQTYDSTFFDGLSDVKNLTVGADGKVALNFKGEDLKFDTIEDAASTIHGSYFSDRELAAYLAQTHNMKLEVNEGVYKVSDADGKQITEFENVEDFFMTVPHLRPPKPIQAGPNILITSPVGLSSGQVSMEGLKEFKGDMSKALRTLGRFQNTGKYEEIKQLANGNVINKMPNGFTYSVNFKNAGVKLETNDYDEALSFAGFDLDKFDGLEALGRHKGYDIAISRVGYTARDVDGNVHNFKTAEQAQDFLAKQDDLGNLAEITGQADEVIGTIVTEATKASKIVKKGIYDGLKSVAAKVDKKFHNTSLGRVKANWFETQAGRFERLGDEKAISYMNKTKQLQQMFHSSMAEHRKSLYALYGKYDAADRRAMGEIMLRAEKEPTLTYSEIAEKMNFKLTDGVIETLDATRKIFDLLGQRYGVSKRMWLGQYYPHLKDIDPTKFQVEDVDSRKIMQDAFGTGPNADYAPFFQFLRTSDMSTITAFKNDILSVTESYIKAGERSIYFGDQIKEINDYLNVLKENKGNHETMKLLQQMRDQVAGRVYSSEHAGAMAERILLNRARAEELLKNPKFKTSRAAINAADAMLRNNLEEFSNDLITATLMAGKLRLPLRNMFQIYTTNGALVGTTTTLKAQQTINNNFDELYDKWEKAGILMTRDPLDPTLTKFKKWLKGYNSIGMNFFKTSDDYTRMVAAESWDIMFKDSLELLKTNKISYDRFKQLNWFGLLDKSDLEAMELLMKKGQTDLAGIFLAQKQTALTMFDYDVLMKPEAWKSGGGKLFGQYQTYPIQYMRMLAKVAKAADPIELAMFSARLMANTAAVGYFMHDVIGMQDAQMTPLSAMRMTGGPWFSSMARMYSAVTAYDTSLVSKGKAMWRASKVMNPLFGMPKKIWESASALVEGEAMLAAVHAIGATPAEESWTDPDLLLADGLESIYGVRFGKQYKYKQ